MINKINFYINKLFNLYYWYEVRVSYKNKQQNTEMFSFYTQIGVKDRKDLLKDRRVLNKINAPFHKNKRIPKKLLCNGTVGTEVKCYLGRMGKIKKDKEGKV